MRAHYKITKRMGHWLKKAGAVAVCITLPISATYALPVIPGAAGFGINTPAGRGGAVYRVTNLDASGSGSLNACVNASGPRVCIFEISGTITLERDIRIRNPNITIAGQTAPSPGITIRGAAIEISADDVLIQHLRLRTGDLRNGPDPDNRNSMKVTYLNGKAPRNIVIANNSLSWGVDQLVNVYGDNVTFYNNFFTEALHDSTHSKGPHSKGPLLANHVFSKVSMIGNLLAHNEERNPLARSQRFVFVNNMIYNWGNKATDLQGGRDQVTQSTLIGNYYKPGPNSSRNYAIVMRGRNSNADMTPGSKVYVEDNITPNYDGNNPWSAVHMEPGVNNSYRSSLPPVWNQGLEAKPASDVEQWVLQVAGARPADRDPVDIRVVSAVRNGGGGIINSQRDVGGWPALQNNRRTLTLPDFPNRDSNGNGYTNLEEWLHKMAAEVEGRTPGQGTETPPPSSPANLRFR